MNVLIRLKTGKKSAPVTMLIGLATAGPSANP